MGKDTKKLPLSGDEPTCTKAPFSLQATVPRNNCYAYAIQHLVREGNPYKLQPGNLSGKQGINFNLSTCTPTFQRVLEDLTATNSGYKEDICKPCKAGYGKIALVLSNGNDFHFLRQNGDIIYPLESGETVETVAKKFKVPLKDVVKLTSKKVRVLGAGVWSHKRGTAFAPTLYDAKGQVIFDPRKADLNYGMLNYSKFCSTFCVKQKPCTRNNAAKKSTSKKKNLSTARPKKNV